MERNEEIKCASKDYVNYLLDKQEYHNEKYTEHDIKQAFEKGAEWADEHPANVWHDVSEEPNIDEDVVLYDSCGNFVTEFYNGDVTWNNIVVFHKATMWAYSSDLSPKGGER